MKRLLFGLCLLLAGVALAPRAAQAQNHVCGSDHVHTQRMQDPAYATSRAELEAVYLSAINSQAAELRSGADGDYYVIPCVVHVVWGDPAQQTPGRDSISKAQIHAQFQTLFEDFRNMPGSPGYSDIGVDTRIEFTLATIDPTGNPTDGIVYYNNPTLSSHERSTEENTLKSTITWPKNKYFNIWIVNQIIEPTNPGLILGYADFPTTGTQITDGIVIRHDCFGVGGVAGGPGGDNNAGRTVTHEAGHWLNLYHTFQSGCGSNCQVSGDNVCDTPPTPEATYGSVSQRQNRCTNDSPDLAENNRNYMDYVSDKQMIYFTPGQATRMWTTLDNQNVTQRYPLWQTSNLVATGTGPNKAPTAQFVASHRVTNAGNAIQFRDYSRDVPTSWQWSFPGGTPATSTSQNPLVTYDADGTYDVQLIVNNNSNTPDTVLMTAYITVLPAGGQALPYTEGFDNSAVFPTGWQVWSPDSAIPQIGFKWGLSALSSGFGQSLRAARINCGTYWSYFQEDHLVTPILDLTAASAADTAAMMTFSVGYAPYQTSGTGSRLYSDTLSVGVSTDAGLTWTTLYRKGGTKLSHNGVFFTTTEWGAPTSTQWQRDTVDLRDYVGQPNVMLRFTVKNGAGNNLFLDDINVRFESAVSTPDPGAVFAESISVAPNPTAGTTTLSFTLAQPQDVHIEVLDLNGRTVLHTHSGPRPAGAHSLDIDMAHRPAGLYLARLVAGGQSTSIRIVKQ